MSKLFRKIIIIALVSVFVLGVSVSASAATQWTDNQAYDRDQYVIDAFAYIYESSTHGEITVNEASATDVIVSIDVTYNYFNNDPFSGVHTDTASKVLHGGVAVHCSGAPIVAMIDANYTFEAEFPVSTAIRPYRNDSVYLRYWPQ